jgi:hypothetical protein
MKRFEEITIKIDPELKKLIEKKGSVQKWINYHLTELAWMHRLERNKVRLARPTKDKK